MSVDNLKSIIKKHHKDYVIRKSKYGLWIYENYGDKTDFLRTKTHFISFSDMNDDDFVYKFLEYNLNIWR